MGSSFGKTVIKNLSGIYSQKIFDHVKESAPDTYKKILKRVLQETDESTSVKEIYLKYI